jgi:hypothetical protein
VAEPVLPLVCRPVGEVDHTRSEHPGVHELHDIPVYPLLEEALSATQDDRVDHVPEFVEEPTSKQSTWSSSPLVPWAVFRNTVLSPVTGFTSSSPALAMVALLCRLCFNFLATPLRGL